MLPVLQSAAQGEVKLGDVVTSLAKTLALTDEEVAQLFLSGRQNVFANRVSWAKFGLNKAELIESTRHGYLMLP
ncbi:winged helix-turn-helix domain-containing protein [Cylindrospermopsis raciborskii]